MLCKRCILPEAKPNIYLNEDGICNICVEYENQKKTGKTERQLLEIELIKQLERYKNKAKGKYDCMVLCSGGKDSAMSLYYAKEKYHLNPLVFTFDHGFENKQAVENVKRTVEILNVDWMYYKSNYMMDVFFDIIKNNPKVSICHICTLWYIQLSFDIATRFNIPIIIGGWTKGQSLEKSDCGKEYEEISNVTRNYVVNTLKKRVKYRKFPQNIIDAKKNFRGLVVSPHWYIPWNIDEVNSILKQKLQWVPVDLSYPEGSTNCLLNFASVYLSMKYYGYTHYHIEMAKLIREGEITREEALKKLKISFDKKFVNKTINKLGCKII